MNRLMIFLSPLFLLSTAGVSITFLYALGLWLMFAPFTLGFEASLADGDHLVGALIITFSVIAMAEVARYLRFINIVVPGAWLIAAP